MIFIMSIDLLLKILIIILLELGIIYVSYRGGWENGYSDGLDYADNALRTMIDDTLREKDKEGDDDKSGED